jgi:hypothetical protein
MKSVTDSKWQKEAAREQSAFSRFRDLSRARRAPFARDYPPKTGEPIMGNPPKTREPIMGNNRLFSPKPESRSWGTIGSLQLLQKTKLQKKAACPQELDSDFGGPFTHTSRTHALRPKPEPEPEPVKASRPLNCVLVINDNYKWTNCFIEIYESRMVYI